MQVKRTLRVRMDSMGPWHFTAVFFSGLILLVIAMIVGWTGPQVLIMKPASPDGENVVLYDTNQLCKVDPSNVPIIPISRCWSHYFLFNSRWTQYFDIQMLGTRFDTNSALPVVNQRIPLQITWYGLEANTNPLSDWKLIYSGNTSRSISCAESNTVCDPILLFRTNSVPYERYFVRVAIPDNFPSSTLQQLPIALSAVTFNIRYRSADFAMFELGFKATFLVISFIVFFVFLIYTGLDCGCGKYFFCFNRNAVGLNFQRQQGVNWLLTLQLGLILFNEPLLWMRYYARDDAGVLSYLSVGGQLTFVAILLAYWLVEWGLIKSNPNRIAFSNPCRFYCPKLSTIFVYWILAIAVYGWILVKQQEDPLFDWVAYANDTINGHEGSNARLFLIVWSALMAVLYLSYLTWLIVRSLTVLCSFTQGEKYLFSLHFLVLVATGLGLAGGAMYGVEVNNSFDFMFFNALYNIYVYILVYLYTPLAYTELDGSAPPVMMNDGATSPSNGGTGFTTSSMDGNNSTNGITTNDVEMGYGKSRMNQDGQRGYEGGTEEALPEEDTSHSRPPQDDSEITVNVPDTGDGGTLGTKLSTNDWDPTSSKPRAQAVAKALHLPSISTPQSTNDPNSVNSPIATGPLSPTSERLDTKLAAILASPPKKLVPIVPPVLPSISSNNVEGTGSSASTTTVSNAISSKKSTNSQPSSRRSSTVSTTTNKSETLHSTTEDHSSSPLSHSHPIKEIGIAEKDSKHHTTVTTVQSASEPDFDTMFATVPAPATVLPPLPPKPQVIVLSTNTASSSSSATNAAYDNPFESFDGFNTSTNATLNDTSSSNASAVPTQKKTVFDDFESSFGDDFANFK